MTAGWLVPFLLFVITTAAFGVGMARFFRMPAGPQTRTRLVGAAAAGAALCQAWTLCHAAPSPWQIVIATALYLLALVLFAWASRACQPGTLGVILANAPSAFVVRRGPYARLRHPFYTAYVLFWTAGCVASAHWAAGVAAAVMTTVYVRAAWAEEASLRASAVGADYNAYAARTGFMWPACR